MLFKRTKNCGIGLEIASGPNRYWYYIDKDKEEVKIRFGFFSCILGGKYKFWRFVLGPFMLGLAKKM